MPNAIIMQEVVVVQYSPGDGPDEMFVVPDCDEDPITQVLEYLAYFDIDAAQRKDFRIVGRYSSAHMIHSR